MNYLQSMLRRYYCICICLEYVFVSKRLCYFSASLHSLIHFWMCKDLRVLLEQLKIALKIKDLFWRKDLVSHKKAMLKKYQQYLPSALPAPPPPVTLQGLPHNSESRCKCQNFICIVLIIYKILSLILYCLILMNDSTLLGHLNKQVLLAPSR